MRAKISTETWAQLKVAYASGIGLREMARNMNIPEGTVLSRAQREGWTPSIASVKGSGKARGFPNDGTLAKPRQQPKGDGANIAVWRVGRWPGAMASTEIEPRRSGLESF